MTIGLTEHQIEALDAYEALMKAHPALFVGRPARPIVRDREALARYASDHGVVLGLAADTPFALFINDLVESRLAQGGAWRHPYLRVVARKQLDGGVNVVVLATIANASLGPPGAVVLVDQERHATGGRETALPRGFGEPGLSGEANALRELREETGYVGERATLLGTTETDSGMTDARVSFYHVAVVDDGHATPETTESIAGARLATPSELRQQILAGDIRDGFTLQAVGLYALHSGFWSNAG